METVSVAEQVTAHLATYLGPFNARVAVKTLSTATLRTPPEGVTLEQLPALLGALRPVLYTFAGQLSADLLLEKIKREVK